jgi:hypothetical protein
MKHNRGLMKLYLDRCWNPTQYRESILLAEDIKQELHRLIDVVHEIEGEDDQK